MGYLNIEEINDRFIDYRNKSLWEYLLSKYTIGVNDDFKYYRLDYKNEFEDVNIMTTKEYNKGLFTHELLHLNIRKIGLNTLSYFQSNSQELILFMTSTICNCIEHVLFFDVFIEMGYRKEDFVMDYNNSEYNLDSLKKLCQQVKNLKIKPIERLFTYYSYWTLKNEEYMGVDRSLSIDWMKKTEPTIFSSCERMFDEIIDFDLDSSDVQDRFNILMARYLRRNY